MENQHCGFVLVIDSKYWNRLCGSQKDAQNVKYFVRRGAAAPRATEKLLFYVAKRMQILGEADFTERIVGDREDLWTRFGAESFFESADEYREYAGGSRKMTFLHFKNFKEIIEPKSKNEVVRLLGSLVWLRPRYVSKETTELLEKGC